MDGSEKGGFIPGQALVRIAVSVDASLEVRDWNGTNVVWLHAPLRCDEEWKVASHVAEVLNALAGQEFMIGSVKARGIRLCEPCSYLSKITFPETLRGLVHKGGLRAQILSEGIIRVGDPVLFAED